MTHYDPLCVEIEARLAQPGLVILADQFYPGWELEVSPAGATEGARKTPVLRVNRVMRGAWLPPGVHRLVYRYRPWSLYWGAVLSGIGWAALVGFGLLRLWVRRRPGRA